MDNISQMSPSAINTELARIEDELAAVQNDIWDTAGRENERPSDWHRLNDPLSNHYRSVRERFDALRQEIINRTGKDYNKMPRDAKPIDMSVFHAAEDPYTIRKTD